MFAVYTIGSTLIVDIEETASRAQMPIAAGIRNMDVPSQLSPSVPLYDHRTVPAAVLALPFLVPLFTPADRQSGAEEAMGVGFSSALTLVDPTAIVPTKTAFGEGCYVNAGVILGAGSRFGRFVVINRATTIGHHAVVEDFASFGPGVVIAGNVTIGRGAMIGAGAVILPDLSVGANAVVGAGTVVTKDVPPHSQVIGNPARITKTDISGFKGKSVI
jgi:sugar O-acyltransferase (sialic acid O-acetyltransferase NeuD family)